MKTFGSELGGPSAKWPRTEQAPPYQGGACLVAEPQPMLPACEQAKLPTAVSLVSSATLTGIRAL